MRRRKASILLARRFWRFVRKGAGCWEWQGATNANGYGRFRIATDRMEWAHRAAYELTYGALLPGYCILHRCDNRRCVRPSHVFVGTKTHNAADRDAKGRTSRGVAHSEAVKAAWARRKASMLLQEREA